MFKAEFELEAITPIFMRGADQSKAEIRASSIKGLMRWWFRALAGNYFGDDIAGLRRAEEYVFGSTGQRSRVIVEVEAPEPEEFNFSDFRDLSYLWFSIKLSRPRYYYSAGIRFKIKLKGSDYKAYVASLVSLWALACLGGIGFRSRRGAGSVRFVEGDFDEFERRGIACTFTSYRDLTNSINNAINAIGEAFNLRRLKIHPQTYPILSSETACVGLWNPRTGNPVLALKRFQNEYTNFRRKEIEKKSRIVFGLPIKLSGKGVGDIRDKLRKLGQCRRGSPMFVGLINIGKFLHVKIIKFYTDPYHPDSYINDIVDWLILSNFDESLNERTVFGSLEVFK